MFHSRTSRFALVGGIAATIQLALMSALIALDVPAWNAEVTAFGDTVKTYVAGLPDASGSFSGFLDDASAQTYTAAADGLARRFYLYPTTPSATGPYWFGTALFDFNAEADVGDSVKMSGDWSAASAITKIG